ncbi:MAG: hypothetical protein IKZ82_10095 [Clostridia bacterium]|nr:hypothetical protein [Clostridia bacterium]
MKVHGRFLFSGEARAASKPPRRTLETRIREGFLRTFRLKSEKRKNEITQDFI